MKLLAIVVALLVITLPCAAQIDDKDNAFLEDPSRRCFQYFVEQADPGTGLVRDRARSDGSPHDLTHRDVSSIAATGFGLTAWCIGAERGWISRAEARGRTLSTLRFLAERASREHGWFYHWMDARTGKRVWTSEVSSIDTALLMAGVLTSRAYFSNVPEIVAQADRIYREVDFRWMLNGHPLLLSHGWKPETGFLQARWDTYSEHGLLYLLAIGSPTHGISPQAWYAWRRPAITYAGHTYVTGGPLFIHQFSHAWVDFRGRSDRRGVDFFANSVEAVRAHRQFCLDLAQDFPGYTDDVWGITASDSEKGYVAWGGPPREDAMDGTVVPCAAGGSLMLAPDLAIPALRAMRKQFGDRIYGRYGFLDAFNPNDGWVDSDVVGIDVGILLLSAENLRSGDVWKWFMKNPEIGSALTSIGFTSNH